MLNEKDHRNHDHRNRQLLLKRLRRIWIDGLLHSPISQNNFIHLHLQEQPTALTNAWQFLVQEIDHLTYPLPVNTSIVQIYDEAEGELLHPG